MAPSTRTQNALLAALAAVAVGASGFAIWVVNRPHPSLDDPRGSPPGFAFVTDDAAATTAPANDSADTTASPTTGPMTTSAPDDAGQTAEPDDPAEAEATVTEWLAAWEDEADLLVIGDGYSNLTTQWVQEWAARVGRERPVQIRHWAEAEDRTFAGPIVLSEEDGPALRVWSASRGGTTIGDAIDRLERFDRAAPEPAAMLISLGMDSDDEDVPASMDELLAGLDDVPVLLTIAPEQLYPPGVADDLLAWADDNAERVAVVDLRESGLTEPTAEEWAQGFEQALADSSD